ncbi:uncharacterized protein TNCT_121841 [Trichonephila clavata]|uniref:Uncharacterized protein n=1 Tax=Trichonephila clavata TaxID=2740835 RepID=A0A8X6KY63_TRICU|nr:uncharacterized protein TNCT_121841 [Trichonephila clavata]
MNGAHDNRLTVSNKRGNPDTQPIRSALRKLFTRVLNTHYGSRARFLTATDHLPLKLHATAKGYVAIFDTKKTDKESLEGRMKNNRWRQQKSQPINWKPYYCVLLQDDRSFTHFPTEEMSIGERLFLELPRVRLDGGRQAFRRRWGYDMGVPSVPEEDEDSSELSETTSLRDERLLRFSSMGKFLFHIILHRWQHQIVLKWSIL